MRSKFQNIGLVFFIIIGVLPFGAALTYATLYSFGVVGVANDGFTLSFWAEVLKSGEFFSAFGYSAIIAIISVTISVSAALWLTLVFKKEFDKSLLSFVIYLPLAVPGVVSAFFTFQLFTKSGFFARLSHSLGWISQASEFPDLVNDQYAIGIILTFITIVMPFFLLLFLNVYKNERIERLSQLSASLGASERQTVWKVSLPIMLRKTWTLIALYFIFLLGAYEVPLILGQESPQMLSVLIIRELKQFDLTKLSEGYVVAVIYTILVSIGAIFLFSNKRRGANEI